MNMIRKQIHALWHFLRVDLKYILPITAIAGCVLFLCGLALGVFVPDWLTVMIESFTGQLADSGIVQSDGSFSVLRLMWHNWTTMMKMIATGCVPFLFLPAILLSSNFLMIGAAGALYIHYDYTILQFLSGILPHGIFELPALILAISCGFYVCLSLCRIITRSLPAPTIPQVIGNVLRTVLLVITPLTVIAAYIEVYVTPLVMALFM